MEKILEKRLSLHRQLSCRRQQNDQLRAQITQLQSLANIGTVSLMIAHEINNVLTPLAGYAQLALTNPQDRSLAQQVLDKLICCAERVRQIQQSLLALVSGETLNKQNCQLKLLIEQIFQALCRDFAKDKIKVVVDVPVQLELWAVPVQMQQVLMNLILNAREAMLPQGGLLTITAAETVDTLSIQVTDTGCGIEPALRSRIFELFFTTKIDDSSTLGKARGLGLAFCKQIVDAHDGFIRMESRPGEGTCFGVFLPKHPCSGPRPEQAS